jgi:enterochelin esterase-like enzyme
MKPYKTRLAGAIAMVSVVGSALIAAPASAQEWGGSDLPPAVEHTGIGPTGYEVTFRLFDPTADRIQIVGEWEFTDSVTTTDDWYSLENKTPDQWEPGDVPVASLAWPVVDMTRGTDGVWSYTVPLPGGLFNYGFIRDCGEDDGTGCDQFADPSNRAWNTAGPVPTSSQVYVPTDSAYDTTDVTSLAPAAEQGKWTRITYNSPASTEPVGLHNASVYVPPGYDETRSVPYPTLYLSHGGGGNETEWSMSGAAGRIVDNAIAAGTMQPTVIVATNFYGLDGEAGYVADVRDNLIPAIEGDFNVSTEPSARALAGLSLGSQRTQGMMETEPTLFDSYAAWSGGRFEDELVSWTDTQVDGMKAIPGGIVIGSGKQDFLAHANTEVQQQRLSDAGIQFSEFDAPGGHTWQYWRDALAQYISTVAFRTTAVELEPAGAEPAVVHVRPLTDNPVLPTGNVSIYADDSSGDSAIVGRAELVDGNASVTVDRSALPSGQDEVNVVYSGDALFNTSNVTVNVDDLAALAPVAAPTPTATPTASSAPVPSPSASPTSVPSESSTSAPPANPTDPADSAGDLNAAGTGLAFTGAAGVTSSLKVGALLIVLGAFFVLRKRLRTWVTAK